MIRLQEQNCPPHKDKICSVYRLGAEQLENCPAEKYLGVLGVSCLTISQGVRRWAKKATGILAWIRNHGDSRTRAVIIASCMTLVRLHLEHSVHFWGPRFRKDIKVLEWVQSRTINLVKGLERMSYEEQLRDLGLFSLE